MRYVSFARRSWGASSRVVTAKPPAMAGRHSVTNANKASATLALSRRNIGTRPPISRICHYYTAHAALVPRTPRGFDLSRSAKMTADRVVPALRHVAPTETGLANHHPALALEQFDQSPFSHATGD